MDDSQRAEFAITVSAMFEAFGQEATKPRLLGYWLGLQDLDLPFVQQAVTKGIRECKHLPTPAELRELAGLAGASDRAVLAWNDVLVAIPRGPYKHIDFEDPCCNAAIRMLGGWPTFLERFCDAESEKWARLDFLKTYQSVAAAGVDGEAAKPLAGLAEVQKLNGSIAPVQPVRIGCTSVRPLAVVGGRSVPVPRLRRAE